MNFKQKNIDLFFTLLNVSKYPLNIGICKQTHYQKWSWHFYTSTVLSYLCSKNDFFRDVIIFELRVTSYELRVGKFLCELRVTFCELKIKITSCQSILRVASYYSRVTSYYSRVISYFLRVENKNYELQVMALFHLKKKITKHAEGHKSLMPV